MIFYPAIYEDFRNTEIILNKWLQGRAVNYVITTQLTITSLSRQDDGSGDSNRLIGLPRSVTTPRPSKTSTDDDLEEGQRSASAESRRLDCCGVTAPLV